MTVVVDVAAAPGGVSKDIRGSVRKVRTAQGTVLDNVKAG